MIEKSRGETGVGTELSEQAVPGGVERPALHAARHGAHEAFGAAEHFLGGAAGEGEEEDALGRDAALEQVRDAVDQRARLAGAGAGDDEQRTVAVGRGGSLLVVQLRARSCAGRHRRSRAG